MLSVKGLIEAQELILFGVADRAIPDFAGKLFMTLPLCHEVHAVADAKSMFIGNALIPVSIHVPLRYVVCQCARPHQRIAPHARRGL